MKPNAEESRSDLTFDWSLRESRVRSLFYAFAFALAGGLAALVIFQVTTAVNKKPQAPSQAIVILDPSSLAAQ